MEIIKYPGREEWSSLIKRPALDVTTLFDTVRTVLDEVREQGDIAVKAYEEKFDKVLLSSLQVSEEEMREADALVAEDLKQAIRNGKGEYREVPCLASVSRERKWRLPRESLVGRKR